VPLKDRRYPPERAHGSALCPCAARFPSQAQWQQLLLSKMDLTATHVVCTHRKGVAARPQPPS